MSIVITELATTAIIVTLINIQPKLALALPDLVFKTNQSNSELESFKQCALGFAEARSDRTLNQNLLDVKALLCRANALVEQGRKQGTIEYYLKALEDYSLALYQRNFYALFGSRVDLSPGKFSLINILFSEIKTPD